MDIEQLDIYYEDCVIGGPGAFVIPIKERDQFKEAIRTKLVLEIAGRVPERRIVPASAAAPRISCTIGERLWQERWGLERPRWSRPPGPLIPANAGPGSLTKRVPLRGDARRAVPPTDRSTLRPFEARHDLDMGGMAELVDRRDRVEPIAAVDQDAGVAREGRRIARHRDDDGNGALGKLARLRLGALARRIEHHRVEALEFRRRPAAAGTGRASRPRPA